MTCRRVTKLLRSFTTARYTATVIKICSPNPDRNIARSLIDEIRAISLFFTFGSMIASKPVIALLLLVPARVLQCSYSPSKEQNERPSREKNQEKNGIGNSGVKKMLKSIASAIAIATLLTPAIANEYWVVLDPLTQKCSIVEKKTQQSATDATGTGTDEETAKEITEGTGTDKSPQTATDTTEETTTETTTTEGTTTDSSQETATAGRAEGTTTQETAANTTEAQTATDEDADSSKTAKKIFIGSAYPTRDEAEYRITIMRKCGIAN
jgi:hypothetical protein